jgi:hypothetical protein
VSNKLVSNQIACAPLPELHRNKHLPNRTHVRGIFGCWSIFYFGQLFENYGISTEKVGINFDKKWFGLRIFSKTHPVALFRSQRKG